MTLAMPTVATGAPPTSAVVSDAVGLQSIQTHPDGVPVRAAARSCAVVDVGRAGVAYQIFA
jgi:hypothetical protein